ncbi:MAG: hypothetical protein PGN23_13740 [Sphingomonas adhaesiva]|uniref:hypothetical protein n=1 Tax=Sphingomonas adhaesiva TaxID=28212 RepID=UPI002FF508E0
MSDIDRMLEAMREAPGDPRLAEMEATVMTGVAARRAAVHARRSVMLAAVVALGVGVVGTTVPGTPAAASPAVLGMSDFAPSRLLDR